LKSGTLLALASEEEMEELSDNLLESTNFLSDKIKAINNALKVEKV
jgi:hypothetical protein